MTDNTNDEKLYKDILSIWEGFAQRYYSEAKNPNALNDAEIENLKGIYTQCIERFNSEADIPPFVNKYPYEVSKLLSNLINNLSLEKKDLIFSDWPSVEKIVENAFTQVTSNGEGSRIWISIHNEFAQKFHNEVINKDNIFQLGKLSALSVFEIKNKDFEELRKKIKYEQDLLDKNQKDLIFAQKEIESNQARINTEKGDLDNKKKVVENLQRTSKKQQRDINRQQKYIKEQQGKIDESVDKAKSLQDQVQKLVEKTETRSQDIMNTSMTVLGIFVTVVVTVFGSLEVMNGIATIENLDFCTFVFYLVFVFASTINIVFLLLHTLSRISGKNIASHCKKYEENVSDTTSNRTPNETSKEKKHSDEIYFQCQNCKNKAKCRITKQMRLKYPFVFYPDLLLFIALAAIFLIILFQHDIIPWLLVKISAPSISFL